MKKVIGIDLGTTNSVAAFKTKNVEIIRNKEHEELTRSCVGVRNNQMLVGKIAYSTLLKRDPENLILSVKRLMGGAIIDDMIQKMKKDNDYYRFGITSLKGGTEDAVALILGGKQYTPEQISAEIIRKLKEDAEHWINDEISHIVLTVPAYFTEKQKNATRLAAHYASIKVSKILAEPTAAAIAYGVDDLKPGEATTVLIYDFGGGTFDLSVLNIVDGQYLEMGTGGDRWLGGDDIDKTLRKLIYEKVANEYSIDDLTQLIESLPDKKRNLFLGEMREKTEDIKIQLSSTTSATCIIDDILEDENGDNIDVDITVTRKEFEELIRPIILKSIDLVESLLNEMNYDIEMIDSILLVGGTSCIPLVKEMLSAKYGQGIIKVSKKPMLSVAEGAAILAHRLSDEYECPNCGKTVKQTDGTCKSCHFDLEAEIKQSGIAEVVCSTNHNLYFVLKDGNDRIIEKQHPLPVSISRSYRTVVNGQRIMKIEVLSDIEDGNFIRQTLGFLTIDEELPADSEITFDFTLDVDEVLSCKAYPKTHTNKAKTIILERGQKDAGAFKTIENLINEVNSEKYNPAQKKAFLKSLMKQLKYSDEIGIDNPLDKRWAEIHYKINVAFDDLPKLTKSISKEDEKEIILSQAQIMVEHYYSLIGTGTLSKMKQLIAEVEDDSDVFKNIQAMEQLKELINENNFILIIALITIAADNARKKNPSDANTLLEMHDLIVNHLKNEDFEEYQEELGKAMHIAKKYLDDSEQNEISTWLKK